MNGARVEKKLASMLVDGPTTTPENWNEYRKIDQRLKTYKKNQPYKYRSRKEKIVNALRDLKRDLEHGLNKELDFSE